MECPECDKEMLEGMILVDAARKGICWMGDAAADIVEPQLTLWGKPKSAGAFRCGVCEIIAFSNKWPIKDDGKLAPIPCPECEMQMERGCIYPYREGRYSTITVWFMEEKGEKEERIRFTDTAKAKYKDISGRFTELFGLDFAPANKGHRCPDCGILAFNFEEKQSTYSPLSGGV